MQTDSMKWISSMPWTKEVTVEVVEVVVVVALPLEMVV